METSKSLALLAEVTGKCTDEPCLEVEPLDPAVRYYGLVSITNNETQHVSLVAPTQGHGE